MDVHWFILCLLGHRWRVFSHGRERAMPRGRHPGRFLLWPIRQQLVNHGTNSTQRYGAGRQKLVLTGVF